ncbi:MAG: hypothetical protein V1835_00890 [Candidatus Micrarchaeota archaeon]
MFPKGTVIKFRGKTPVLPEGTSTLADDFQLSIDASTIILRPNDPLPYLFQSDELLIPKGTEISYRGGELTINGEFNEAIPPRMLPISTALLLFDGKTSIGYSALSRRAFTFPAEKSSIGKEVTVGREYLQIVAQARSIEGRQQAMKIEIIGDPLLKVTVREVS